MEKGIQTLSMIVLLFCFCFSKKEPIIDHVEKQKQKSKTIIERVLPLAYGFGAGLNVICYTSADDLGMEM